MNNPMQFIRLSEAERGPTISNIQLAPDYPWPPPAVIYTVAPHGMGWTEAVMAPDIDICDEIAGFMEEAERDGVTGLGYTMTPWRQVSCSKLDAETVAEGNHVARGAEYVPMGKDDEE